MKEKTKQLLLIWFLLILGATLVTALYLINQRKGADEQIIKEEGIYKIGNVSADTEKGKIWFRGKVSKDGGWIQHLVYLEGYKWLREESAIIAEARLIDLQKAIALLDWRLWDELWYEKQVTSNQLPVTREKELLLFVQWDRKKIPAQELVLSEDKLEIGDFIFLGSPHFDHIALEAPPGVDCRLCPIFPLEEKALRETFIRESGQSGYELNSAIFPSKGTEVSIILKLK